VCVQSLMRVAGMALRDNLKRLGPKVLPLLEQTKYLANLGARRLLKMDVPSYLPDFNRAFDHFCIHTGARHMRSTCSLKDICRFLSCSGRSRSARYILC
jgi:hypothetical protein